VVRRRRVAVVLFLFWCVGVLVLFLWSLVLTQNTAENKTEKNSP
jgi:phage shock protein PspC (stress-responsive transcriptional regulator)